jgi:pimeloyl-ACP methyl ester carboxylesterase
MQLNTTVHGDPTDRPPLVIAHGLFGSARNWGGVARALSVRRQVIAVDMRNHGDSPRSPDHGYEAMAGDLADVIAAQGGQADLLGHSMGGKAAMVLALSEPDCLRRLIVADIAPVAYGHSQARYVRAMQALDLGAIRRRSEADRALAAEVSEPDVRAFLLQSLAVGPDGAAWKLNLPALAEQMPRIMGFPDLARSFAGPALFLTGGNSDYVRPEHWSRIRALFPQARAEAIAGAGHWLHADAAAEFAAAVEAFLE